MSFCGFVISRVSSKYHLTFAPCHPVGASSEMHSSDTSQDITKLGLPGISGTAQGRASHSRSSHYRSFSELSEVSTSISQEAPSRLTLNTIRQRAIILLHHACWFLWLATW